MKRRKKGIQMEQTNLTLQCIDDDKIHLRIDF
jgi:hypothetical protein